jgi:hypothetical protein
MTRIVRKIIIGGKRLVSGECRLDSIRQRSVSSQLQIFGGDYGRIN